MRHDIVQVSKRWCDDAKRYAQRFIIVNLWAHQMLDDLQPDKKEYWTGVLRGVDTRRRLLYDCSQVTQTDNQTISSGTGTSNRPQGHLTAEGDAMRGDEEE
jgi:hypothetical protein